MQKADLFNVGRVLAPALHQARKPTAPHQRLSPPRREAFGLCHTPHSLQSPAAFLAGAGGRFGHSV